MATYYVDIPTIECMDNPDAAFRNVAQFDDPEQAVKFCQEHFGADEKGCVSLISPAISASELPISRCDSLRPNDTGK